MREDRLSFAAPGLKVGSKVPARKPITSHGPATARAATGSQAPSQRPWLRRLGSSANRVIANAQRPTAGRRSGVSTKSRPRPTPAIVHQRALAWAKPWSTSHRAVAVRSSVSVHGSELRLAQMAQGLSARTAVVKSAAGSPASRHAKPKVAGNARSPKSAAVNRKLSTPLLVTANQSRAVCANRLSWSGRALSSVCPSTRRKPSTHSLATQPTGIAARSHRRRNAPTARITSSQRSTARRRCGSWNSPLSPAGTWTKLPCASFSQRKVGGAYSTTPPGHQAPASRSMRPKSQTNWTASPNRPVHPKPARPPPANATMTPVRSRRWPVRRCATTRRRGGSRRQFRV